jgi:hypothetical protein
MFCLLTGKPPVSLKLAPEAGMALGGKLNGYGFGNQNSTAPCKLPMAGTTVEIYAPSPATGERPGDGDRGAAMGVALTRPRDHFGLPRDGISLDGRPRLAGGEQRVGLARTALPSGGVPDLRCGFAQVLDRVEAMWVEILGQIWTQHRVARPDVAALSAYSRPIAALPDLLLEGKLPDAQG